MFFDWEFKNVEKQYKMELAMETSSKLKDWNRSWKTGEIVQKVTQFDLNFIFFPFSSGWLLELNREHQTESAEPALFGKDKFDKISGLIWCNMR